MPKTVCAQPRVCGCALRVHLCQWLFGCLRVCVCVCVCVCARVHVCEQHTICTLKQCAPSRLWQSRVRVRTACD